MFFTLFIEFYCFLINASRHFSFSFFFSYFLPSICEVTQHCDRQHWVQRLHTSRTLQLPESSLNRTAERERQRLQKNDYYWNVGSRGEESGREISVNVRLSDWSSFRSGAATLPRSRPAVRRSTDERTSRTKRRASGGVTFSLRRCPGTGVNAPLR